MADLPSGFAGNAGVAATAASSRASSRSASPGTSTNIGGTSIMEGAVAAASAPPAAAAATGTTKRRGGKTTGASNPLDAVTLAALSSAVQYMTANGFYGLASLLTNALQDGSQQQNSASLIPSVEAVQQAAKKAIADQPVWVHWSKQDMAPQFKCDSTRLTLTGAMRGYRMARASHGVDSGYYYFECLVLSGPAGTDILHSLPSNARLGPGLREQLQRAMQWEEAQKQQASYIAAGSTSSTQASVEGQPASSEGTGTVASENTTSSTGNKKRKADSSIKPPDNTPPSVGGHVRIGWSMRTGDLQAPVGYDKWSYGIRDIGGSIIHCSRRQDDWGGDGFTTHDVVGCAICFDESDIRGGAKAANLDEEDEHGEHSARQQSHSNNHIRFFKNADCMGHFVLSKGKREGGEAFVNIERGVYYPAVSSYMGGSVRVNFGPYWVCPPKRSRLPVGLKNLKPISSVVPQPVSPEEAVNAVMATAKLFRKLEHQQALKEAVQAEAEVRCQAYHDFLTNHVEEVRQARIARGLSVADLPDAETLNRQKAGATAMEVDK